MRKKYWIAITLTLSAVILVLSMIGPSPASQANYLNAIKPGMTEDEVERILPKQRTTHVLAGPMFSTYRYEESGIAVSYERELYKGGRRNVVNSVHSFTPDTSSYIRQFWNQVAQWWKS